MGTMDRLFQLMAEKKASDIFVSVGSPIHIKIGGTAVPINQKPMNAPTITGLLHEILTDIQYREYEETLELNTGYALQDVGNFRLSIFRQKGTPAMVVRYIPAEIPRFETLNLPSILAEVIMEKRGLLLMVGASGSGKSTTLTSLLDLRNENRPGHILTLEDPIEFIFKNKKSIVNQREIGADTRSFELALKNALRQAPDCIFIGEIRDKETMSQAVAYAQSGHLCLATLHANNSYHALSRIISFYPLDNRAALLADLAVSLKCIVSQRLVNKVDGGSIPAVEVMLNSRHVADMVEKGDMIGIKESMDQSMSPGSQTFEQSLFNLYKSGVITLEVATANADSANNLLYLIHNADMGTSTKEEEIKIEEGEERSASGATFSELTLDMGE